MRSLLTARNLFFLFGLGMFVQLVYYFFTGSGGATLLATRLLPVAVILWALQGYDRGGPYERLPRRVNLGLTTVYVGIAMAVFGHFYVHFERIAIMRNYDTPDMVIGALIFVLVMEVSRKVHPVLFGVNLVMIVYTLFGQYSPIDFFWHPGASVERLVSAATIELSTGVFGQYTQMALTLIAAFMLLAAVANGFGAQHAVIRTIQRFSGRSRRSIPFTSVLASVAIGMVSGSGAANAAVTGNFTIPLMKRHGLTGVQAGGIESAGSIGGLILPPLMAVAGFLMAEFMGVPYWDVVMRGFSIATVYFGAVLLAVYLMAVRTLPNDPMERPKLYLYEYSKTALFFGAIVGLIILLGVVRMGAMRSALYASVGLLGALLLLYIVFKFIRRDDDFQKQRILTNLRTTVETHADLTWYLVVLMATLGIMIGLFTITGFLLRMGSLMVTLADWNILATILLAWAFGWLAGAGLPPTATYVIVAVIILPPLIQWGVNPWVAHFFAFLMAIWGELSPPTSLAAAVASRIANASFLRTIFAALRICLPITLMTFGIFVRSDAVIEQGWMQLPDTILLLLGSMAFTYAVAGKFFAARIPDVAARVATALVGSVALFHPAMPVAGSAAGAALVILVVGVYRLRKHDHLSDYNREAVRLAHEGSTSADQSPAPATEPGT